MRAISIWQPWASAIAVGAKCIETRSWATKHRGLLAIHASKRLVKSELVALERTDLWQAVFATSNYAVDFLRMPLGAVVATANLVDCVPYNRLDINALSERKAHSGQPSYPHWTERRLGNYGPGRYGWCLENVTPIKPIPYRGEQGLFTIPDHIFEGAI